MPQGKIYEVLDNLIAKGLAELSSPDRQKEYRTVSLRKVIEREIRQRRKQIRDLEKKYAQLQMLREHSIPIHSVHSETNVRLFTLRYKRR